MNNFDRQIRFWASLVNESIEHLPPESLNWDINDEFDDSDFRYDGYVSKFPFPIKDGVVDFKELVKNHGHGDGKWNGREEEQSGYTADGSNATIDG